MPYKGPRKTAPGVRNGRVQKKNRHAVSPTYWNTRQPEFVLDRERPGRNYRHLLRKGDIQLFIKILPDWDEIVEGLDAIVLARGSCSVDGWYHGGVIGICAWERRLEQVWTPEAFEEHREVLERLGVPVDEADGDFRCEFTEDTARAFQLCHVLLHELGHHLDRMSTHNQRDCARGEPFAEEYAVRQGSLIWSRFCEAFGHAT